MKLSLVIGGVAHRSISRCLWFFGVAVFALLSTLPIHAAVQISQVSVTTDGHPQITFTGNTASYYILYRSAVVTEPFVPVKMALGANPTVTMVDGTGQGRTIFYRVREVPASAPLDTDQDGIDDEYELNHSTFLNPLNPADAQEDFDGDGLTNLEEYRLGSDPANGVFFNYTTLMASPDNGESGVSVNRETILHFDRPLADTVALGTNQFYTTVGTRQILGHIEISKDRKSATMFYLEPLPAGSRVKVTFDGNAVLDNTGHGLDADHDGKPGGIAVIQFDTATITPVPVTAVIGNVYASELQPGSDTGTNAVNRPLQGVIITVDGAEETLRAVTDVNGFFQLSPAPAGDFFVHIDGRPAVGSTWPGGDYYPVVGKQWNALPGIKTNLAGGDGKIYLPLIKAGTLQKVSATLDTPISFAPSVVAANPSLTGVKITVPANSLFTEAGGRGGEVGIAPVPPDRLPSKLPPALSFPLVITVQTDGPQNFDQPVPVQFPNLPDPKTGKTLPPGAKTALWSFNHDIGDWVVVGPATISADGKFAMSDPGVGIRAPGWHGISPGSGGSCDNLHGGGGTGGGTGGNTGGTNGGSNGSNGGSDGGTNGSNGGSTGGDTGGTTGGDTGGNTGGDTGGDTGGSDGGTDSGSDGGSPGDNPPGGDGPDGPDSDNSNDNSGGSNSSGGGSSGGGAGCGSPDCGCGLTGDFVSPAQSLIASVIQDQSNPLKGTSPNGLYAIEVSQSSSGITIEVKKAAGGATVLLVGPIAFDGWGFSPDDHRFVYFYRDLGGATHIFLHDLQHPTSGGPNTPFVPVWTRTVSAATYSVGFSPHGAYLLFAYNLSSNNSQVGLAVARAQGGLAYEAEFTIAALGAPGGSTDTAGWGWSPDCGDRSLVYSFVGSPQSATLRLVNLTKAGAIAQKVVLDRNLPTGNGEWKFSQCGDVFGISFLSLGGGGQAVLVKTKDGTVLHDQPVQGGPISFRTEATKHIVSVQGTDSAYDNIAARACGGPIYAASAPVTSSSSLPLSTGLHYFAIQDLTTGKIIQRGRAGSAGVAHNRLILGVNQPYRNYILKAATLEVGWSDFISGNNGVNIRLPDVLLRADVSPDTDGDGLHDLGELIMGTNKSDPDTDGDGVLDGAEVKDGSDPNSGLAVATGVIGSAPTPGRAVDICALNGVVAVASSQGGVTLFNVFSGLSPNLIAQVQTPGSAVAVAASGNLIAAAVSGAGLSVIDISQLSSAHISQQVSLGSTAQAVATDGGIAYVGLASGEVVSVDMVSGAVLNRLKVNGAIQDVAVGQETLYALVQGTLYVIDIHDGDMSLLGNVTANGSVGAGGRRLRLFVGGNRAYTSYLSGFNVFDLTDPQHPTFIRQNDTTARGWIQMISNGSGTGLATVGAASTDDGPHNVSVYDLGADKAGAVLITTFETPGLATALAVYNGLLYVADGNSGLEVINYLAHDTAGVSPTISLSASFSLQPAQAEEGKLVRVSAAVDDDVQVRNVEFFVDGVRIATDGNFPFEVRFVTPSRSSTRSSFKLKAKATDTGGNFAWTPEYTVNLVPDATPPRVKSTFPTAGAIVGSSDTVIAYFSEPINTATLTPGGFAVVEAGPDGLFGTPDDVVKAAGTLSWRGTINAATLMFPTNLPAGQYRATVRAPVADLAGNAIASPVSWQFWIIGQSDRDHDGVPDNVEVLLGLDPDNPDTDGNGVLDGDEDFDGDGLKNRWEILFGYDPRKKDTDGNGINDGQEDPDNDGLNNLQEQKFGTNPFSADTDGDGRDDASEVLDGTNPLGPDVGFAFEISSRAISFLNAVPEQVPSETQIQVTSSQASYLNAVPDTIPTQFDVTIFSPATSYLNGLLDLLPEQFVVTPLVSYKNQ